MSPPRIMLVAEPPAGPKVAEHLLDYGDVDLVRPKRFTTVPAGTEWVLVMNGGPKGSHIRSEAARVGAHCVAIPPGWSAARAQLDRAGFFKVLAETNTGRAVLGLTQRPFAGIAALAGGPAPDVATALRVEGAADHAMKVLTEVVGKVQEAAQAAQEKAMETVAALDTAQAAAAEAPKPPAPGVLLTAEHSALGVLESVRVRRERAQAKRAILRMVFDKNPDATISEAAAALRTMSLDGRGMGSDDVALVRNEVRKEKGLPPIEGPKGWKKGPQTPAEQALAAAEREGNPVKVEQAEAALLATRAVPSPTPPPSPEPSASVAPPPVPLAGAVLPPDVETAARLLREALEASGAIATYNLTYVKGQRPRQRWTATVENDSEV